MLVILLIGGCSGSPDGKAVLGSRCIRCHGVQELVEHSMTEDEWQITLDRMVSHGARLKNEERAALIEYLLQ